MDGGAGVLGMERSIFCWGSSQTFHTLGMSCTHTHTHEHMHEHMHKHTCKGNHIHSVYIEYMSMSLYLFTCNTQVHTYTYRHTTTHMQTCIHPASTADSRVNTNPSASCLPTAPATSSDHLSSSSPPHPSHSPAPTVTPGHLLHSC